jgi:hypothetical protein
MTDKKIPIKEFIAATEHHAQTILKNFVEKNTQFSTKFIVHKFLSQNEKQLKIIQADKSITEKPLVPEQWLAEQDWINIRQAVEAKFDLENLNFIEATQLAVHMNEYLMNLYRAAELKTSSVLLKRVLSKVIAKKSSANLKLKMDYTRLSNES